jgi:hypothetical protein
MSDEFRLSSETKRRSCNQLDSSDIIGLISLQRFRQLSRYSDWTSEQIWFRFAAVSKDFSFYQNGCKAYPVSKLIVLEQSFENSQSTDNQQSSKKISSGSPPFSKWLEPITLNA